MEREAEGKSHRQRQGEFKEDKVGDKSRVDRDLGSMEMVDRGAKDMREQKRKHFVALKHV